MELLANLNWLGIGAATVATFLFGWAWHSPLLFQKLWMEVNNLPDQAPEMQEMMLAMVKGILNTLLINAALAALISLGGAINFKESLTLGLIAWAGLSLYESLGMMIWEQKSFTALWLKAGHTLGVVIIGIGVMHLVS